MSVEASFTKENLNNYLRELGKEFRKLNGTKTHAEIVLIGGAAVLANYGFREMTNDIDAIIIATSVMKEAINNVRDRMGLPNDWLNIDFKRTKLFSEKLLEVSKYYKTYSNILTIRTISAEYLIAMKLMSGREYKNDLSDIAGILLEHRRSGTAISRASIEAALNKLYDGGNDVPENAKRFLDDIFIDDDYEKIYREIREGEKEAEDILLDFDKNYPGELKGDNINTIIEQARQKIKT